MYCIDDEVNAGGKCDPGTNGLLFCCSSAIWDSNIQSHHQCSQVSTPAITAFIRTQQGITYSTESICLTASPLNRTHTLEQKIRIATFIHCQKFCTLRSHRILYNNYFSFSVFSIFSYYFLLYFWVSLFIAHVVLELSQGLGSEACITIPSHYFSKDVSSLHCCII